jgi:hypothetical protein
LAWGELGVAQERTMPCSPAEIKGSDEARSKKTNLEKDIFLILF